MPRLSTLKDNMHTLFRTNALLFISLLFLTACSSLLFLTACSGREPIRPGTVPIQRELPETETAFGEKVLQQLRRQYRIDDTPGHNRRANHIVNRLAQAAESAQSPWRVYILEGDTVKNAAATRGNYIFVWTGLLREVRDDNELAGVLAHEMAHVLASHTTPTASEQAQKIFVAIAQQAAGVSVGGGQIGSMAASQAAGMLGQATLVNPGSQRVELEADHIGLFLMARAGFNPKAILYFWNRMNKTEGSQSFTYLSTHPSNAARLKQLEQYLPRALEDYRLKAGRSSFALDVPPVGSNTRQTPPQEQRLRPSNTWVLNSDWAALYKTPNATSAIQTHFFYKQLIVVDRIEGRWLHVLEPKQGFVLREKFVPTR